MTLPAVEMSALAWAVWAPIATACALVLLWRTGPAIVRATLAVIGATTSTGAIAVAAQQLLERGGWSYVGAGGWMGAAVVGELVPGVSTSSMPLALLPHLLPCAIAIAVAGLVSTWIAAAEHVAGTRSAGAPATALVVTALAEALVLCVRLEHVAAMFALVGVAGVLLPLSAGRTTREESIGAMRAFVVHRVGDALLVGALLITELVFGSLDVDAIVASAPSIDAWAPLRDGVLVGVPARQAWFIAGMLIVVAVASRLALLVWPLVRDATAGGPLMGLSHGVASHGAAIILLVKLRALLLLAPEAMDALVVVGSVGAAGAGLLAVVGRDLPRIDLHLLSAAASVVVLASGLDDAVAAVLGACVLMAASVALCSSTHVVVERTGVRDPFALGALESRLPRSHSARLLSTAGLFWLGPFAGYAALERIGAAAMSSSRVAPVWFVVVALGLFVSAVAAWRALHLVFTGKQARTALVDVVEPGWARVLPPLLLAFVIPAAAVLALPAGLVAWAAPTMNYSAPLSNLAAPGLSATDALAEPLRASHVAVTFSRAIFDGLLLLPGLLAWAWSTTLYRGGPGRTLARLESLPGVARVTHVLATLVGRESAVARGVGEGAQRLSRLLASSLLPGLLDFSLRRLPATFAWTVSGVLRALQSGGAQWSLVLLLVVAALGTWLAGGAP